jgi:hypothetical protein
VASGTYNPVTGQGASALQSALLNGYRFSTTDSDVKSAKLNIQHKLFALPGGDAIMSLGGEYDHTSYKISYGDLILRRAVLPRSLPAAIIRSAATTARFLSARSAVTGVSSPK